MKLDPGSEKIPKGKWQHLVCSVLVVASFSWHHAFEGHASCVYLFIHSLTGRHLGFQFGAFINKAARSTYIQVFV